VRTAASNTLRAFRGGSGMLMVLVFLMLLSENVAF
jgi:hypothetical protein